MMDAVDAFQILFALASCHELGCDGLGSCVLFRAAISQFSTLFFLIWSTKKACLPRCGGRKKQLLSLLDESCSRAPRSRLLIVLMDRLM